MWFFAIGFLAYTAWNVMCLFSKEEQDYSTRYYSKSASSDQLLMLLFCVVFWPFLAMVLIYDHFDKKREELARTASHREGPEHDQRDVCDQYSRKEAK